MKIKVLKETKEPGKNIGKRISGKGNISVQNTGVSWEGSMTEVKEMKAEEDEVRDTRELQGPGHTGPCK